MRRLKVCMAVGLILAVAATAGATSYFSFTPSELVGMSERTAGSLMAQALGPAANQAQFAIVLSDETDGESTWGDLQIGYDFPATHSAYTDLSAYDTYIQSFENLTTDEYFNVNLYLNSGWTDPGWHQDDEYVENVWTWITPGQKVWLTLDLNALGTIEAGAEAGAGDDRAKWISSIGFNIGSNTGPWTGSGSYIGDGTGNDPDGLLPYGYDVAVNVIPEPFSVATLFMAVSGLGMYYRRRRRLGSS